MTKPTAPDWDHWRHMPEVELWQACALSLDLEPDSFKHSRNAWMRGPGDHGPHIEPESFRDDEQQKTFHKRLRLLKASLHIREHFSPGTLNMAQSHRHGVRLSELAAWAAGVGWTLPAGFPPPVTPPPAMPFAPPSMVAAVLHQSKEVAVEQYAEKYQAQLGAAEPSRTVNEQAESDDSWKALAQAQAKKIIREDASRDFYPPAINIADRIAADFRSRKPPIVGASGKPLKGSTIKRHALKGISSAVMRAQSTQTGAGRQGKRGR